MKIAIIGAGAMGSLFGGHLARVADVCLYDVNKAHVDAVREHGLKMTQGGKAEIVRPRATTDPAEIGIVDAAIFFTKFTFMEAAVRDALHCIGPDTLALTLQNGIGGVDVLRRSIPEAQIAYGLTAYTSDFVGPGHIELTTLSQVGTYFWPSGGSVSQRAEELASVMRAAGFEIHITSDVDRMIWRKLMVNCSENTLCALLRITVGQAVGTPECYGIIKRIVFEISDVARAKGIDIPREEGMRYVDDISRAVEHHLPSMALDVKNRRKTEIACLNEAVVAEGAKWGVPTPTISLVAQLIRTLEANYANAAF